MNQEEEIQKALTAISLKIELLEKKRKGLKQWNIFITLLVLGAIFLFIASSFQKIQSMDGTLLINHLRSLPVRQVMEKQIQETLQKIFPKARQAAYETFIKDQTFSKFINDEITTFLTIAESDLSHQVTPHFILLASKQKRHLYEAFPELKDNPKVEKAMAHLIQIGAPRLRNVWIRIFKEHIHCLLEIYSSVKDLKDPSLAKLPSLEKAVLGVTLELFGRILTREGEKGEAMLPAEINRQGGK
ncbi:MAG: hypothetical protein JW774_03480 [Candidatus Aureabacteria bacterium]|nr:hypothetical protein [Candidatus Auribacterota bacterium]